MQGPLGGKKAALQAVCSFPQLQIETRWLIILLWDTGFAIYYAL